MKIICIGRNYADHITELRNERPESPIIFFKPDTAVLPKKQPFYIPDFAPSDVNYEVELLVRINRVGKHIQEKFAHKYYEEIGLGLDFTARNLQQELKEKGLPWDLAKGFDGAAVIGSTWINKSQFEDLNDIDFSLRKNQALVQKGNTSLMLWKVDELIAYISKFFTLKIGDILFTGTPAGVGPVAENDQLTGYIGERKIFSIQVK